MGADNTVSGFKNKQTNTKNTDYIRPHRETQRAYRQNKKKLKAVYHTNRGAISYM